MLVYSEEPSRNNTVPSKSQTPVHQDFLKMLDTDGVFFQNFHIFKKIFFFSYIDKSKNHFLGNRITWQQNQYQEKIS